MPKQTLKEKELAKKIEQRKSRGYRDYLYLLLIVVVVWLLEAPAIIGLLHPESKSHFNSYGSFMLIVSLVGFSLTVLLLALDKRKASVIISVVSAALILLFCALIYTGYEGVLGTSENNAVQIIVSYVTPVIIPIADIIMVKRRI